MQTVASDAEHAAALKAAGPGLVVTDYTATWCGPCRFVAPLYAQLSLKHPDVKFLKVDIDTPELAATVSAAGVSAVVRGATCTLASARSRLRCVYSLRSRSTRGASLSPRCAAQTWRR